MNRLPGARAARKRINGTQYNMTNQKPKQTCIIILPGLITRAEHLGICAPLGRNGLQPLGEYFQEKLIIDIREKERLIKERLDKK